MQIDEILDRSQRFAKLLVHNDKQALVFLQRDNTDKLQVLIQLWSCAADAQVRALVDVETDGHAMAAFDSFTDETIGDFIASAGMTDVL